jgi:hypothetical protein
MIGGVLDGLLASPTAGTTAPGARLCLEFATAEDASAFAASAALREAMRAAKARGAPEIWVSHHDQTEDREEPGATSRMSSTTPRTPSAMRGGSRT